MRSAVILKSEFVEFMPNDLDDETIYISIPYATVSHKCCCGCGLRVVTPLSPTGWILTFDGESVSLTPSIGNWSFPCRSHYFVTRNRVKWAPRLSRAEIEAGRKNDRRVREEYYDAAPVQRRSADDQEPIRWWRRLRWW